MIIEIGNNLLLAIITLEVVGALVVLAIRLKV